MDQNYGYIKGKIYLRGGGMIKDACDLENEYLMRYSEIVEIFNEQLETLNAVWKALYCGFDDMDEGSVKWNAYGQFIAAMESLTAVENNLSHKNSRITMDVYNNRGEPKIIGIIDQDPKNYFETEFIYD